MVRAKFKVAEITQVALDSVGRRLILRVVYDQTIPEDRRFAEATPSAELTMYVNNPRAIEYLKLGESFYVTFDHIPPQE